MTCLNRRALLLSLAGGAAAQAWQIPSPKAETGNQDWICPMDPEVRADKPGVCPRCGMKLVLKIPERLEFPLEVTCSPENAQPNQPLLLTLRVAHPATGKVVSDFEIVHEKLFHLFILSENLEYFLHDHPVLQKDGSFTLEVRLPFGGMYRLLADYYPAGSVPQLSVETLFVAGPAPAAKLAPSLAPFTAENLTASLHTEPAELLAGLESRLIFSLDPAENLEPYLGAWGHMLAASADLIDLLHIHPFLVKGGDIQFNVIFPRPGLHRIWTQFQRNKTVNLVVFTVAVKAL